MKRKKCGHGGNSSAKGVIGNKGGHGVKGNKGGHGVKGNDGNATTGQKKRAAGRRSGLRRSTKMLLVVKNPWLDLILTGE